MPLRANYATVYIGAQLAPPDRRLDLDWAVEAGDETDLHEFEVPTGDVEDPYVGIQAFDVDEYGHEIVINDEPLSGFDIPPADGWQYWVDTLSDVTLEAGTNTVQIRRDATGRDAFAVATMMVHWKEPVD